MHFPALVVSAQEVSGSDGRKKGGGGPNHTAELCAFCRAETMVCFTAFSLKADQMPIFGLLLVFFLLKSLHFMNFPQNDD